MKYYPQAGGHCSKRFHTPWVGKFGETRPDRQHRGPPRKRGPNKNPPNRAASTRGNSLCDSPDRAPVVAMGPFRAGGGPGRIRSRSCL